MASEPARTPIPLEIHLFGPIDVRVGDRLLPPLRVRKGYWLLALLVLRHGREVERRWLAETLWPDSEETQALASLRRTLADLRAALGAEAYRLRSPTSHTLTLDLTGAHVDVLAFDAAIEEGKREEGRGKRTPNTQHPIPEYLNTNTPENSSLREAVELYRGPLLEGCTVNWMGLEREAREQTYLEALERLAELAIAQDTPKEAIPYLRRVISIDPLREGAQRRLMQALAASGDYAAALYVYRELRLLLRREMNADPDPQTTVLFQQLRSETRSHAQVPPKASPPDTSPALRSRHLPRFLTGFVGREREAAEVVAMLDTARLVTLIGAGGVGKTRLAVQVAEARADDYPDGVWFVDLSALSDPALVPQAVASALNLHEQPDRSLMETLQDYLLPRSLLILLDNCEHLVEACANLAEALLLACPQQQLLATSRRMLGVIGEATWRVPPLSLPDPQTLPTASTDLLTAVADYESVHLFVRRASAASPFFALTEQNAEAVMQVCRQLDGVPLALELAAARLRAISVEQLAARLHDLFRLLTQGSRTAPPRQQTLRTLMDWSYNLLDKPEKILFERLAVFSGGWTLEAAEEVGMGEEIAYGDVLDLLATLIDSSLVMAEGNAEGEIRYRFLETVRQYAREKLREAEAEETVRERHLDFFLTLAEEADAALLGAEQKEWVRQLEIEYDNLRTALDWALQQEAGLAVRLAGALWRYWWLRGILTEGRAWLEKALAADTNADVSLHAKALGGAGILASTQGDNTQARKAMTECLVIRRTLGDSLGIARALNNLAKILFDAGYYAEVRPLYEESLAIKQALGDTYGVTQTLGNLGLLAQAEGDFTNAHARYVEALELARQIGDRQSIAWMLVNLGEIAKRQGDRETAHSLFIQSLVAQQEVGHRQGLAECLMTIATLHAPTVQGVRLMGAADFILEATGIALLLDYQADYETWTREARAVLGEAVYAQAWSEGRAMTQEQAVEQALEMKM